MCSTTACCSIRWQIGSYEPLSLNYTCLKTTFRGTSTMCRYLLYYLFFFSASTLALGVTVLFRNGLKWAFNFVGGSLKLHFWSERDTVLIILLAWQVLTMSLSFVVSFSHNFILHSLNPPAHRPAPRPFIPGSRNCDVHRAYKDCPLGARGITHFFM